MSGGGQTMETETPRIQELIDLVVEKLFTVSLLAGHDADSEFEKGLMAVEKAAQALLGASLDPEYLAAGLTQLVEQRLPDQRVIENFPQFPWLMKQMIGEGSQAVLAKNGEGKKVVAPERVAEQASARVVLQGGRTPVVVGDDADGRIVLRPHVISSIPIGTRLGSDPGGNSEMGHTEAVHERRPNYPTSSEREDKDATVETGVSRGAEVTGAAGETGVSRGAKVTGATRETSRGTEAKGVIGETYETYETGETSETDITDLTDLSSARRRMVPAIQKTARGIAHPGGPPEAANRLNYILKREFPNSAIRWNLLLGGTCFLAQVENLLIYLRKEGEDSVPQLVKEGWRIVSLTSEDLVFPRRIERFIHFNRFSGF